MIKTTHTLRPTVDIGTYTVYNVAWMVFTHSDWLAIGMIMSSDRLYVCLSVMLCILAVCTSK